MSADDEKARKLIYKAANLVNAAVVQPEPHWALISSLLAYSEEYSRWIIERHGILSRKDVS